MTSATASSAIFALAFGFPLLGACGSDGDNAGALEPDASIDGSEGAPGTDGSVVDGGIPDAAAGTPYIVSNAVGDQWVLQRAKSTNGHVAYDYHPQVMYDAGTWRMWWCGYDPAGKGGDHILYAEATDAEFAARFWHAHGSHVQNSFNDLLGSRGVNNPAFFDARDTCDPSVIRVGGTYYLYYGGTPLTGAGGYVAPGHATPGTVGTYIGVATSSDGFTFTRQNKGNPIVEASNIYGKSYGAGEATVVHKVDADGVARFYLSYYDTTGIAGVHYYLLRSSDPTFQTNVESFVTGATGPSSRTWVARTHENQTAAAGIGSMQYHDQLDTWISIGASVTHFYAGNLSTVDEVYAPFSFASLDYTAFHHRDHDSFARDPEGHALVSAAPAPGCTAIPLAHFTGAIATTPMGAACTKDADCAMPTGTYACDAQTLHCFDNDIYRTDLVMSRATLNVGRACPAE